MGKENRDIAPVLLKFGVALALSFGGVLYSLIKYKRSKASRSPNDPLEHSDCNIHANSKSNHLRFDPLATEKHEELHDSNNTEIISAHCESSPKEHSCAEKDTHEQEIKSLRNTIKILKERESNLEIKLHEFYGLKEQETVVMELQNCLKLNNMEAKLFALKIESLQAENRRLEAQTTDYKKVVTDLEAAQTKIKMLKKKLKSEAEQNKKQILDFHQRVQKMQEDEYKHVGMIDPDIESELQRLTSLEAEVADLRKANDALELEKVELAHRLDCVQILATSVLEDAESEEVKEESQNLKKQNEELTKEIERLQVDRCSDVEELVYLRWINACLRYELRNYQPGPSQTTARDLSKNLSPKSEEKAKQLILEYSNKEGGSEKGLMNLQEIDSHRWSNSQGSTAMDSCEFDQSFVEDYSLLPHKNNKFFGKLMRILRGKDKENNRRNHSRSSSRGRSESAVTQRLRTSSMETKKLRHRHSDSSFYNQIDLNENNDGCKKSHQLVKYAEALKDTRQTSKFKSHRRSPSLTFF